MEQTQQDVQPSAISLEPSLPEELCMEEIIDKLRLLNYEKDFCRRKKPHKRLLPPAYFAQQGAASNQAEQFMYFSSLAAWLLQLAGLDVPNPKDHEDPNSICNNLMSAVRRIGFAAPSYPPTKLTPGWGREVCALLWALAEYAIAKRRLVPARPVYRDDSAQRQGSDADGDQQGDQDESELLDDIGFDEGLQGDEDEEQLEVVPGSRAATAAAGGSGTVAPERQILESKVDPTMWRLELERLGPQLRITVAADSRDWRGHLDQARAAAQGVEGGWGEAQPQLERMGTDVGSSLDKLDTRESYLNQQLHHLLMQYQAARQQGRAVQEEQERHSELVSERNDELARLVARLDEAQAVLEERGSSMADASPLVRIKAAMKAVKEELRSMDVRCGVVAHTLLQWGLRERQARVQQGMMAMEV